MRGEVVKDVSARAPAERCFPGSISQMARDIDLVAFLEDERRGILGNVPVDGPIAGIDPIGLWSGVGVEVGREWAHGRLQVAPTSSTRGGGPSSLAARVRDGRRRR